MEFTTEIKKEPIFALIYGPDGVGKTTFAAEAPKAVIVGPENGASKIRVARPKQKIQSLADVMGVVKFLRDGKHDFQSIGIDSLDWLEPEVWKSVCVKAKVDSIEDVGGGFGKGYLEAMNVWREFIASLQDLRHNRNMNVICIAHEKITTVNDPRFDLPYDRHGLKLQDSKSASAAALWREAVDAVLFATFDDTVFQKSKRDKAKATGGDRVFYANRSPAFDAKNRLGLQEGDEPWALSFQTFAKAVEEATPDAIESVLADLEKLGAVQKEKDPANYEKMQTAVKNANGDVAKLIAIRKHTRKLVGE